MPRFNLEVNLYDNQNEEQRSEIDNIIGTRFENIELKVYRFKNDKIELFTKTANEGNIN